MKSNGWRINNGSMAAKRENMTQHQHVWHQQ